MNNDQQLKILCQNIKSTRAALRLSIAQLTHIMKISPKTLSRLESGEIPAGFSTKALVRLSQFLHVELKNLFQSDLLERICLEEIFVIPQNRFKALREERGLTPDIVAEHLACGLRTYGRYEAEIVQIPARTAVRLAEFYGVSVDYLVGLTDQRKRSSRSATEKAP